LKTWRIENLALWGKGKQASSALLSLLLILDKKKPLADLQQGALYNSVMDHMLLSVLARPA
jgi:hypothetical protein